ncbi:uncharacterized protein At5g39865-like [Olea europaea subsp. europaea]|uniref:Uncharacterized protein At5g39865-like n=1 Tax=Olea europaea subsp. europaea TaxID=158383 RepID=A0A8S0UB78_OLEEU|nr:uncharacterized protein At5g39865-like [Olea europaea subsp. europaea]
MGCSASCPSNFITQQQNPGSNTSNSHSNSQLQSPFSDPCSTPVSRTLSLPNPLVHHPPLCKGDSNHFVSLTSTTYGSLVLVEPSNPNFIGKDFENLMPHLKKSQICGNSEDPLSPDSVINTWELMEGLDDDEFNFHIIDYPTKDNRKDLDSNELVKSYEFVEHADSKPLWKHLSEESLLSKMDPNVVSSYRKALFARQHGYEKTKDISKVEKMESLESNNVSSSVSTDNELYYLSGAEDRIVLYYTSLRGIRKTYENCCAVRGIFRAYKVCVDERDISMDSSFRKELQEALKDKAVSLPQVFIRGKYIGGAEEIKQLNEAGELSKLLKGFRLMDLVFVCEICGDARFVPCPKCNGSRKIYKEGEGRMRRCPDCNENGLIRCSGCFPCSATADQ